MLGQVELLIEGGASLFVAGLGVPADAVELCHRHGVLVANMCGKVVHARKAVDAGCDLVVAQGTEAGGHTGQVATMPLVPLIVDAVGDGRARRCRRRDLRRPGARRRARPRRRRGVARHPVHRHARGARRAGLQGRARPGRRGRDRRQPRLLGQDDAGAAQPVHGRLGRSQPTSSSGSRCRRCGRSQAGAFHLGGDESTDGVDPEIECYPAGQGVGGIDRVEPAGDVVRAIVAEAEAVLGRIGAVPVGVP